MTFFICYMGRCGYETFENIRNAKMIQEGQAPSYFIVDMETMLIFLIFVDSPIFLIFLLHHRNSSYRSRVVKNGEKLPLRAETTKNSVPVQEMNFRDSIWLQDSFIGERTTRLSLFGQSEVMSIVE